MYLELSLFLSCVGSLILPIVSRSSNFFLIPAGHIVRSAITSRRGRSDFLPFLHTLSRYFSWYQNDGLGTDRNTSGPFKIG